MRHPAKYPHTLMVDHIDPDALAEIRPNAIHYDGRVLVIDADDLDRACEELKALAATSERNMLPWFHEHAHARLSAENAEVNFDAAAIRAVLDAVGATSFAIRDDDLRTVESVLRPLPKMVAYIVLDAAYSALELTNLFSASAHLRWADLRSSGDLSPHCRKLLQSLDDEQVFQTHHMFRCLENIALLQDLGRTCCDSEPYVESKERAAYFVRLHVYRAVFCPNLTNVVPEVTTSGQLSVHSTDTADRDFLRAICSYETEPSFPMYKSPDSVIDAAGVRDYTHTTFSFGKYNLVMRASPTMEGFSLRSW